MTDVALATYRLGHDRSKDIRLTTVYHTSRRARLTKGRMMDIRLAIVILSEYVGRYSTLRNDRIDEQRSEVGRPLTRHACSTYSRDDQYWIVR